jgi:hypothetical protein
MELKNMVEYCTFSQSEMQHENQGMGWMLVERVPKNERNFFENILQNVL